VAWLKQEQVSNDIEAITALGWDKAKKTYGNGFERARMQY
jgi:hypothetical protein